MTSLLTQARNNFHQHLVRSGTLSFASGIASNADSSQATSRFIANTIATELRAGDAEKKLSGQRAGAQFEAAVESFLKESFPLVAPALRPGEWTIENLGGSRSEYQIAQYEPYVHLDTLAMAIRQNQTLAAVLGNSYEISPDVLVLRSPVSDEVINCTGSVVDENVAKRAIIRAANQDRKIVHAIVSCKWTLRSDRAQNARSEALNMIRNRKGRTPHIAVVTAEPTPSRLASLALGTGDIDMVYHFALPELIAAVQASGNDEAEILLGILLDGERLRDIADLPLDLAV